MEKYNIRRAFSVLSNEEDSDVCEKKLINQGWDSDHASEVVECVLACDLRGTELMEYLKNFIIEVGEE